MNKEQIENLKSCNIAVCVNQLNSFFDNYDLYLHNYHLREKLIDKFKMIYSNENFNIDFSKINRIDYNKINCYNDFLILIDSICGKTQIEKKQFRINQLLENIYIPIPKLLKLNSWWEVTNRFTTIELLKSEILSIMKKDLYFKFSELTNFIELINLFYDKEIYNLKYFSRDADNKIIESFLNENTFNLKFKMYDTKYVLKYSDSAESFIKFILDYEFESIEKNIYTNKE